MPPLSPQEQALADALWAARAGRYTLPPLAFGALDVDAAYRIQAWNLARQGGARVGRKIGLTSRAVQRQLGVDRPDVGCLTADMDVSGPGRVDARRLVQPRIEAEVAFVLSRAIPGDADLDAIRGAIGHVVAAAEIVASVIDGWRITLFDTVADNASAGLFALGAAPKSLASVDPAAVAMTMHRNGQPVSQGSGSACLGDPLNAVAWLARAAAEQGAPLQAGEIILSGALGPMAPVSPGDVFEIAIEPLGRLQVAFAA